MAAETNGDGAEHVLKTPMWMMIIRGFQFLLSLIIVGLAGRLMHDAYLDEEGIALATVCTQVSLHPGVSAYKPQSLITWVVVAYVVLAEKIPSLHKAYHVVAILALDCFLVIMWLATFAAAAAERARYVYDVDVDGCYSDGSLIESKTCVTKRSVILFKTGAAMLAAIAGLGALVWCVVSYPVHVHLVLMSTIGFSSSSPFPGAW